MIRALLFFLLLSPTARADCVILLHGLQGRPAIMAPMAIALADAGYVTFNGGYPSTKGTIPKLSDYIFTKALDHCPKRDPIHVVAHSMGGLLFRSWQPPARLGRVIMISTPNAGSEIVDRFRNWPFYQRINGPAAAQMSTDADGLPATLPSPKGELGVIIGTKSRSPFFSALIPGPDDGRVSIASARSPRAIDTIALPIDHNTQPFHPAVIAQVVHFLNSGQFDKTKRSKPGL